MPVARNKDVGEEGYRQKRNDKQQHHRSVRHYGGVYISQLCFTVHKICLASNCRENIYKSSDNEQQNKDNKESENGFIKERSVVCLLCLCGEKIYP